MWGRGPWPLLSFSSTFRFIAMPFYGRPAKYCDKYYMRTLNLVEVLFSTSKSSPLRSSIQVCNNNTTTKCEKNELTYNKVIALELHKFIDVAEENVYCANEQTGRTREKGIL